LEAKYKLGLFENPYKYCDEKRAASEIFTAKNRQEARAIATQTFVLLKNKDQVLPIKKTGTIALVGPLIDNKNNMPGTWSVAANFEKSVTILQGLKNAVGDQATILTARGCNLIADKKLEDRHTNPHNGGSYVRDNRSDADMLNEAIANANKADVVVAVLGEAAEFNGESSSRSNIEIPQIQKDLLAALLKTGKPVVLVLLTGRPLALTWEQENVPAILNVWFAGSEAGDAIADVLFGDVNPSGKLTTTWPQNVGQVPLYYNHKNTGRPESIGKTFEKFRTNYLDVTNQPLYPFGFGLSYTSFSYGDVKLSSNNLKANETLTASVTVTNTGLVAGKETVQLYIRDLVGSSTRPVKELKGFKKIELLAGESKTVSFSITTEDLKFYNNNLKFDWEAGEFEIMVGPDSKNIKTEKVQWVK
ncbi:MAG: glycoside hydrolase family 3 C-terminal domain-containing protein, partial [Ferruginibacter sp.]